MIQNHDVFLTILGMALVTAVPRFVGAWMARSVSLGERSRAFLEAMPVAVLTAIVVPTAVLAGVAETIACAVTVAVATRSPLLMAVAAGTATVAALRAVLA